MTTVDSADAAFWKRKLAAFLHDSPSKALDVASHEERAEQALRNVSLVDAEGRPLGFDREADHTAAAADRLPFPHWQASGVRCAYDSENNPFRQPMGATKQLRRQNTRFTPALAEEIENNNQPVQIQPPTDWPESEQWRARFFAHWRLWRRNATDRHAGFAALPADTRLPDHTIWTHMGVVSAIAGCDGQPALLKFQLGPVQDFIATSRSTRDLWSGSYLLSWLMAAGLAKLAWKIGPDSVIFPNLWGQPLFDLHLRACLWRRLKSSEHADDCWTGFGYEKDSLRPLYTPNLPNVFLALVPQHKAVELAGQVRQAINDEWQSIAAAVKKLAEPLFGLSIATASDARDRFDAQVARHLDIAWQITPFSGEADCLLADADRFLPHDEPKDQPTRNSAIIRVRTLVEYFTKTMPHADRDSRYYVGGKDGPKEKLNNLGVAWSLAVALNSWQLDAARQLRRFDGLSTDGGNWNRHTPHAAKDALTGRELMLFGGSQEWLDAVKPLKGDGFSWDNLFRHSDEVGAITLIKRTWHVAYLRHNPWCLDPLGMPNTRELASGYGITTYSYPDEENAPTPKADDETGRYYAILAFDGDSIGAWVSGEKTPAFATQLADHCHREGKLSPKDYFTANNGQPILELQRPLSPGYHLQFSEALGNFAVQCAPRVVKAYHGRLLYAGGDDLLAMVPAVSVLACADDLQRVFRGLSPAVSCGIEEIAPGFLSTMRDQGGRAIPLILPGPRATASVGIALAHFMQPLQDVVRAARAAEKRAKKLHAGDPKQPLKHAIGLSLFKRSGEIVEWDTRFDIDPETPVPDLTHRGGLLAVQWILYAMGCRIGALADRQRHRVLASGPAVLSAKFPHRLAELLEPYESSKGLTDLDEDSLPPETHERLLGRELEHALSRQRGKDWNMTPEPEREDTITRVRDCITSYFASLRGSSSQRIRSLLGLLAATAFLARQPDLENRN